MSRIAYISIALIGIVFATSGCALGAILMVDAGTSPANAAPGNSNNILMLVSVTDSNGNAVSGLGARSFAVDATVVGPGGSQVDIKNAKEASRASGFYLLELVPTTYQGTQYKWVKGTYLLSVTVSKGQDRGQAVADLKM